MISACFGAVAARRPQAPAVVDGPIRLTYGRLAATIERLAGFIAEWMPQPRGARIAVVLPNCWEFAACFLAAARVGAICAPLPPQWKAHELDRSLAALDADALVTHSALAREGGAGVLRAAGRLLLVDRAPVFRAPIDGAHAAQGSPSLPCGPFEDDVLYLATSGSTGRPKFVVRTQRSLVSGARMVAQCLGIQEGFPFLSVIPFHHANGFSNCLLMPLLAGGTAVLVRRFTPQRLAAVAREEKVQVLIGSPFIFRMLVQAGIGRAAFESVRICLSSGAAMSGGLAGLCRERLGLRVRQLYGSTETGTVAVEPGEGAPAEGSVGRPLAPVAVRIVDAGGCDLPPGTVGEIAVRSPATMRGYYEDLREGRTSTAEGFLRTGDLGRIDAQGNLVLCGRIRRMVNLEGVKVDPAEIEQVLVRLEGVSGCVVGSSCGRHGRETLKAVVAVRPGRRLTRAAVIAHCRKFLAEFKIPRIIELVEELPANLLGKHTID